LTNLLADRFSRPHRRGTTVPARSGAVYSRSRRDAIKNMSEIAAIFEPSPKRGLERHHRIRIGQFVAECKNSLVLLQFNIRV
jgi:hypothetical protein